MEESELYRVVIHSKARGTWPRVHYSRFYPDHLHPHQMIPIETIYNYNGNWKRGPDIFYMCDALEKVEVQGITEELYEEHYKHID